MPYSLIPAFMRGFEVSKKNGGINNICEGISHFVQIYKLVAMPKVINLHTANINILITIIKMGADIFQHLVFGVEKNTFASVINCPWPSTLFAIIRYPSCLNSANRGQDACW